MPIPPVEDAPVTCRKCGHEFQSYIYRTIISETSLIDQDGDTIFDLVKTCRYCKDVFHWHTNTREMQRATSAYLDMFEKLESALHTPVKRNET